MKSDICDRLGCEFPLFAFSHCRDVIAEVSKAGGFGVLGAVGHTPESLELEIPSRIYKNRRTLVPKRFIFSK